MSNFNSSSWIIWHLWQIVTTANFWCAMNLWYIKIFFLCFFLANSKNAISIWVTVQPLWLLRTLLFESWEEKKKFGWCSTKIHLKEDAKLFDVSSNDYAFNGMPFFGAHLPPNWAFPKFSVPKKPYSIIIIIIIYVSVKLYWFPFQ